MAGMLRPTAALFAPALLSAIAALGGCDGASVAPAQLRVATFNVSLFRDAAGALHRDLAGGGAPEARKLAAILRTVRPDIVLLNEIDFDPNAIAAFRDEYLQAPGLPGEPLRYEDAFAAPVNTGEPSGLDLDADGRIGGPGDAFGYGRYPGQYGLLVLSRFPIDHQGVRTFQQLRWASLPDNALPTEHYPAGIAAQLRLSSKTHVDVPVRLPDGRVLHVLASHPTPPVFDGPEDRNGRRNHDEIRLWAEYLDDEAEDRAWLIDDGGRPGGLPAGVGFVICGDLNADPHDGDSYRRAIRQLLDHPRVQSEPVPGSRGALLAATEQGGANADHRGPAAQDTGDFADRPAPGNLRLDYVLPSRDDGWRIVDCGVFWPPPGEPGSEWLDATDHRLVWVDLGR
jgi:endonuclease/exonuclease/phosphatase family metal-dependent hydrolase